VQILDTCSVVNTTGRDSFNLLSFRIPCSTDALRLSRKIIVQPATWSVKLCELGGDLKFNRISDIDAAAKRVFF